MHFRDGQNWPSLRDVCAWDEALEGVGGTVLLSGSLGGDEQHTLWFTLAGLTLNTHTPVNFAFKVNLWIIFAQFALLHFFIVFPWVCFILWR